MRDYTICKILANEKLIDNLLNLIGDRTIESKDVFEKYERFNFMPLSKYTK